MFPCENEFESISRTSHFKHSFPARFGLYLHVPFCIHKCSYCDFYSFTKYETNDYLRYRDALVAELISAETALRARGYSQALRSIFFGGGTPSLLPVQYLADIFSTIRERFGDLSAAEITLEANPETVNDTFCEQLRSLTPVNRVSMGAQSFQSSNLNKLERLGSKQTIEHGAKTLKKHGFTNFNLDLIFGIPGQTPTELEADIEQATLLGPKHVSFYSLSLKEGHTLFSKLPSGDKVAEMYERGIALLAKRGYFQYEISNFAVPGFESQHNLIYWDGSDYLGVGPSAASRFFWDGSFHHKKQISDFKRYLSATAFNVSQMEVTSKTQTILEASFLELRKNRGIDLGAFQARYGYDFTKARKYPLFLKEGLLLKDENRLMLTARGRLLADEVTRDLVD